MCIITELLYPLLYLWYVIIIHIYHVHPYFSLKKLAKSAHYTWQKYGNYIVIHKNGFLGSGQGGRVS